jgi:hypothetical protein
MSEKLEELVSTALEDTEDGVLAGQALALLMADGKTQSHLTDVSPIVYCNSPNTAIRQQLQQRPLVYLESNQQEASLTESMYHDIVKLSDDLKLDETHVLSLYAHVSVDHVRAELESRFGVPDEALMRNIPLAVETLYWHEQALPLITLRSLLQHRLRAEPGHVVLQVTDDLLQDKLWQSLLEWVRVATRRITEWNAELSRLEPPATHGTSPQSAHAQTLSRHARFHVEQRQLAAECLYFWAYFTQLEATEVAALIDLAKELSNELPVLDPYIDVPSPVIASDPTAVSSPWRPFGTTMHALEKDPLTWQRELIQQTCKTTHVDRLQVISTLVVAILTSLDSRGLKHNRKTHCANDFGTVGSLCICFVAVSPSFYSLAHFCFLRRETLCYLRTHLRSTPCIRFTNDCLKMPRTDGSAKIFLDYWLAPSHYCCSRLHPRSHLLEPDLCRLAAVSISVRPFVNR